MSIAHALTPSLQLLDKTAIQRIRELPISGELLVAIGDVVKSEQIVARAMLPGELLVMRLPESTGLDPDEIGGGLRVKEGDVISEGQVVCEVTGLFGFFRTVAKSPVSGVVEHFSPTTGHVSVRLSPRELTLSAYVSGKVVDSHGSQSVTIECYCDFVQGVFGIGGPCHGMLAVLKETFNDELTEDKIPDDCRGKVVVGGSNVSVKALMALAARGAVGLVTGSIDNHTLRDFLHFDLGIALTGDEDIPFTVIITEGFGCLGMSNRAREIFVQNDGRFISMDGTTQVRAGAVRPEVVMPLDGSRVVGSEQSKSGEGLTIGSMVRIIRAPFFGRIGTVTDLPVLPMKLPTGAFSRVASVRIGNDVVVVPRANLEVT
jgi:hypothetical protein